MFLSRVAGVLCLLSYLVAADDGSREFEASFTADSLSSSSWTNEGSLGSSADIDTLTGFVQSVATNGNGAVNALCFDSSVSSVTSIDYDTDSAVRPDLTMEVWYEPTAYSNDRDWILAHDDGGYDRAILTYDTRFSGLALAVGHSYSSTLGYPEYNEWIHIVATYSSDGTATVYQNGGDLSGGSQQSVTVSSDSGSSYTNIGLNGVPAYSNHFVVGCFARVQLTNRVVSAAEVAALYNEFDAEINSIAPTTAPPTTASPTTAAPTTFHCETHGCDDQLVCDASTGQCQRDCDIFLIDDFLTVCSAEWSSNEAAVTRITSSVATNAADIATVSASAATNAEDIETVTTSAATNAADIATNTADIVTVTASAATNAADIATVETSVTANAADIVSNAEDIATNIASAATNAADIDTVTTSVTTNTADIATNAADIAANTASAASNAEDMTAVETRMDAVESSLSDIEAVLSRMAVLSAHSSMGNVDASAIADVVDDGSWTAVALSGKDVLIVAMVAINVVLLTAMAFVCCRKQRGFEKYRAVSISSD